MKPNAFIYHHLGLGDHIICNGLVRYLIAKCGLKTVSLIVKSSNINNIKRMYRDKPEIEFFIINDDSEFLQFYQDNKNTPLIKVGFDKCINSQFDRSFYDSVKVPFVERWNSWYIERDEEQENAVLKELNIDYDYIFVHNESSVGTFDLNISSHLKQIKPVKLTSEKSIFDWIKVIENAKEIHVINSSFAHLANSLTLSNKLFYHDIKYADGTGFKLTDRWNFINYRGNI